ncbi:MAG: SDR family oxidoreductase [Cyanobacteriota bacterium]|nr:SDR family oxidoreductase [Cyanobacteriota bacterium]
MTHNPDLFYASARILAQSSVGIPSPLAEIMPAENGWIFTINTIDSYPLLNQFWVSSGGMEESGAGDSPQSRLLLSFFTHRQESSGIFMNISQSVAFVTGANRGIGKAYVEALLQGGSRRVYAAARQVDSLAPVVALDPQRVVALPLDITQPQQIAAVSAQASDVTLLINNAGVIGSGGFLADHALETAHQEMDTNYFGTLAMMRAFAPILKANGGGGMVNMLSVVAHANAPVFGSYSASKAALYSLTQGMRAQLASQGIRVFAVFPGPVDTAMAAGLPVDKTPPLQVTTYVLGAIEQGIEDIYPDPTAQQIEAGIHQDRKAVERQFASWLP